MEKEIYLAAGCFWGAEHFLRQIDGVLSTQVGFANGNTPNPSYEQVYTDTTGYAETVHVRYDPTRVSLLFLLRMYFKAIDPTSLNRQGNDQGTRYRTGIYYTTPHDLPFIRFALDEEATHHSKPLCVDVEPLANFYPAEEYHQNYLINNPDGYCHLPVQLFDYARNNRDLDTAHKTEQYQLLLRQIDALCQGETDTLTAARPLPRTRGLHAHTLRCRRVRHRLERKTHPHGARCRAIPRPHSLQCRLAQRNSGTRQS